MVNLDMQNAIQEGEKIDCVCMLYKNPLDMA